MQSIELTGLDDALKTLDPVAFDKAVIRTSNEVITQGFNATKRSITQEFNIKIKTVKDPLSGNTTRGEYAFESKYTGKVNKRQGRIKVAKATKAKRYVEVGIYGGAPNLYLFTNDIASQLSSATPSGKVRLTKRIRRQSIGDRKRVSVQVKRGGGKTKLKNAFIAKMKSGHIGIFQRTSKKMMIGKPTRQAIFERRAHSPQTMFNQQLFKEHVGNAVTKSFDKRFIKNWRFYHGK